MKNKLKISNLSNMMIYGDSENELKSLDKETIDLIFTSPPYFNARPEYSEYSTYNDYLAKMQRIIHECYRILNEGRFFVLNISPVLVKREARNKSSKRLAVPFDFHAIFMQENFDFIDDIIWVKPDGAACGRGRRFSVDRHPLQYKPEPVTEYILVYRKKTDKLIDWHIRNHPDKKSLTESKIKDGYERTNVWQIPPSHSKIHPATFPLSLAERVISYYSFKNDVVLDPFAGIGTVAKAAFNLDRRFVLIEQNKKYLQNCIKWFAINTSLSYDLVNLNDMDIV